MTPPHRTSKVVKKVFQSDLLLFLSFVSLVFSFVALYVEEFVCLFIVCLSVCLSVSLFVCVCLFVFVCLFVCLLACLLVRLCLILIVALFALFVNSVFKLLRGVVYVYSLFPFALFVFPSMVGVFLSWFVCWLVVFWGGFFGGGFHFLFLLLNFAQFGLYLLPCQKEKKKTKK